MTEKASGSCLSAMTLHPVRSVALGYLAYITIGWIVLSLPFSHGDEGVSGLDALFTSASAVSTTGLTTVSTGQGYSFFGQLAILTLIQLGGIGYMTLGSFVVLSRSSLLTDTRREISKVVFSMPKGFQVEKFIKSVVIFTIATEIAGIISLYYVLRQAGVSNPVWMSVFHSVSAFCTAGFGLYDDSFESMRGNISVNIILGVLSYLGAIGFIVFVDVWRRLSGQSAGITLTSRIILFTTVAISFTATMLFFIIEPTIQELPPHERLVASAFQVMTSLTTVGFNTIPIGALSQASLFLLIMLMVIGASPSGTGGGLKTTTFSALFGVIRSSFMGQETVTFWRKEIPQERIRVAIASFGFYMTTLIGGCFLLALTETFPFESIVFEAASALGTVGLSTGITATLSPIGKLIIIVLMFCGRLGPLAFGIALFLPSATLEEITQEDLAI